MRDRLDAHTRYDELPELINRSVELMLDQARALIDEYDTVPLAKRHAALAELEPQIRSGEEARLRAAWLELHGGEPTIH